jgi:tRNA A64-2'-O-ribosylphosphate transferase
VFHRHRSRLLSADKDDLPELVDELVSESITQDLHGISLASHSSSPSHLHPTGVPSPSSHLALAIGLPTNPTGWHSNAFHLVLVVPVEKCKDSLFVFPVKPGVSVFAAPLAKADSKAYGAALLSLVEHFRTISDAILAPGTFAQLDLARRMADADEPRPDFDATPGAANVDARKAILPLALALTLAIPILSCTPAGGVSKTDIADALHVLVSQWPDGNPPRAALKRVNEYLMSDRRS